MSTKNLILDSIRKNTLQQFDKPDLTIDAIIYQNKIAQLKSMMEAGGGLLIELNNGAGLNEAIQQAFPDAQTIASTLTEVTCATINPDTLKDPVLLNGVDLGVVKGVFAVAENACVWLRQDVKYKALYFIPESLVILIDKKEIVNNMHEAFSRIKDEDYAYGTFMSGPSKTADIEQSLVFGAHGPTHVTLILR